MRWGSGWEGRRALLREKAAHGKALGWRERDIAGMQRVRTSLL